MSAGLTDIGGLVWTTRMELGQLEADSIKAQAIVDQLFERNANRTINVRMGSGEPETGTGASPGGSGNPLRVDADTSQIDAATIKVEKLIAMIAEANRGFSGLKGNAERPFTGADSGDERYNYRIGFGGGSGDGEDRISQREDRKEMSWVLKSFRRGRSEMESSEADDDRREMSWVLRSFRAARSEQTLTNADLVGEERLPSLSYRDLVDRDRLGDDFGPQGERDSGSGTRGGLLTRGFTRRFAGGFLAYEALRGIEAYSQEQQQISARPGNLPAELAARNQFNQTLLGIPGIGQLAGVVSYDYQRLTGTGQTTDEANIGATESLKNVSSASNRILQLSASRAAVSEIIDRASAASDFGAFEKRRDTITNQFKESIQSIADRDLQLSTAVNDATDPNERNRLTQDLNQFRSSVPALTNAYTIQREVGYKGIERDVTLLKNSYSRRGSELSAAMEGASGTAAEDAFIRGQQDALAASDPLTSGPLSSLQRDERLARSGLQAENLTQLGMANSASRLSLERRPLEASLESIELGRRDAIKSAPFRDPLHPLVSPAEDQIFNDHLRAGINEKFDLQAAQSKQEINDWGARSSLSLAGQLEQSTLQERGSFQSAEVAGIADAGIEQAVALRQKGQGTLANQSIDVAESRLRAFRRNYARNTQAIGSQDKFAFNLTVPDTGYESIIDVNKEIDKKDKQLEGARGAAGGAGSSDITNIANLVNQILTVITGSN